MQGRFFGCTDLDDVLGSLPAVVITLRRRLESSWTLSRHISAPWTDPSVSAWGDEDSFLGSSLARKFYEIRSYIYRDIYIYRERIFFLVVRRSAEPGKGPIFKVDWSLKLLRHLTFCIVAGVTEGHRVGSSSTLPETNGSSLKNGGWKLGDFFQPVALVWVFWGVFFHDSNLWVQQKCRKISRCLDDLNVPGPFCCCKCTEKSCSKVFFLMFIFLEKCFQYRLRQSLYTYYICTYYIPSV